MKKTFDIKHLPYLAALFQAVQFAHAGSIYFGPFGWVIGGFGGILANLAIASAASRISDISTTRKPLAFSLGAALLLLSPLAIAPAAYISASAVTLQWARLMVSIVWALIPDLSIALTGAIVGKTLISSGELTKPARNKPKEKKKVARKRVNEPDLLAYLQANAGASQQQVADHFGVTRQAIGPRLKKLYAVKQ